MKSQLKLFMIMLGCRPKGRFTEQHDVFFGIGTSLKELVPAMNSFWPEAKGKLHIDVWREVTNVDNHQIEIIPKESISENNKNLYFINLGGYKQNEFDEFHYKMLSVTDDLAEAIKKAKQTSFYKHYGFKGAVSHIDDKFSIDVDDVFTVKEILNPIFTSNFDLKITESEIELKEDVLHIGFLKLEKII